jgi:hypothetical protein
MAKCAASGAGAADQQLWSYDNTDSTRPYYRYMASGLSWQANSQQYCVQIDGDLPWRGNNAVVWDCTPGSWDELMVPIDLPSAAGTSSGNAATSASPGYVGGQVRGSSLNSTRLMIDMAQGGGPQLCMSSKGTPPRHDTPCSNIASVEVRITQTADTKPPTIRRLAAYK